jgi:hypothetical protein
MNCPQCGKVVNWEQDAFLDDVYKGIEKWDIECSGCHYYWVLEREED